MRAVRILVADDRQENLNRAKEQFTGKNVKLTCCPIFSAAADLLSRNEYDILLTDLMMIGESGGISEKNAEIGKEVPYGLILAILAKNKGVKHVVILTDISHHSGPIAWAMDRLLGDYAVISGFDNKDWLKAAEKFASIVDSKQAVILKEKSLMLAGVNDDYKHSLKAALQGNIDVFIVPQNSSWEIPSTFAEKEPTFTLLIGEIGERDDMTKSLFNTLVSMKSPEQEIIVAGWRESGDPHFLRLPINLRDLLVKLSK